MKKLIILFITVLMLSSCTDPTMENSVEDPIKFTTVEMQSYPKDTAIIVIKGNNIYFYDDNLVVMRANIVNNDSRTKPVGRLLLSLLGCVIAGMYIGAWLNR